MIHPITEEDRQKYREDGYHIIPQVIPASLLKDVRREAAKAQEIASNPDEYQVCEGCESIVGSGTLVCPNCHGYRFDLDHQSIVSQARFLGTREQNSVLASDLE